ncbi:protein SSUH2 homolog isoform X1 [Erpetoichthys calabaricus]|uniref:protein SSUH2 homolog isoform X1 n=1 Tax=Erpetoichthys calabaricus TaxID=27687 RepID=UPI002234D5AE|nr:protein SSUH2 homolog isoform X1 [Erpetoichthys calabaricus]
MDKKPLLSNLHTCYQAMDYGPPGNRAMPPTGFPAAMPGTFPGYEGANQIGGVVPPAGFPQYPVAASAPVPMLSSFPGYEGMGQTGNGGFFPPPNTGFPTEPSPTNIEWKIPSLSHDEAKKALHDYVASKCCYGKDPVEQSEITNLVAHNTYRYRLETFTESRTPEWAEEPFKGQQVDANIQPPPAPWNVPVDVPQFFKAGKRSIKVPYTSSLKPCHTCTGLGKNPCKNCGGRTKESCSLCNGSGKSAGDEQCMKCSGLGAINCSSCSVTGFQECKACVGKGQILSFINLNVEWKNNVSDFVGSQDSGIDTDKLKAVTGKELFTDQQIMVYPVVNFPDTAIAQASEKMVREHQSKYGQTSRIIQQKHSVELIPITNANYTWRGNNYSFTVFGQEKKVNAADYPDTCCCTIL